MLNSQEVFLSEKRAFRAILFKLKKEKFFEN